MSKYKAILSFELEIEADDIYKAKKAAENFGTTHRFDKTTAANIAGKYVTVTKVENVDFKSIVIKYE